LERYIGPSVNMLRLLPEQIHQLMEGNVQHAELALAPDGLFIFLNNKPLPYLGWDGQTLANVGGVVDGLGVLPETVTRLFSAQKVLPLLLRGLGVGVVVKFPVASGQEAIPFESHANGAPATITAEEVEKQVEVHVPLQYDQAGAASVDGVKLQDVGGLTGQPLAIGTLDEATMARLRQAQIESVLLRLEPSGLVPYVDGRPMPSITWTDEHLLNLVDLLGASTGEDNPLGSAEVLEMLRRTVPGVREADIQLSAEFPAE